MSDAESLRIVGPVVIVGGLLLMVFHRQFVRLVRRNPSPNQQRVERQLPWLFSPTPGGHVRILWIISVGWVVVGTVFLLTGLGVQPLAPG